MSYDATGSTEKAAAAEKPNKSKNHERLTAESDSKDMDNLRRWFSEKLAFSLQDNGPGGKPSILTQMNLDGIVEYIQAGKCRNIITMAGAGISTSAGVPDFRDPTRGVYSMLRDYNLPYPEMVFQLDYFKKHPEPFYRLAKDLYPTTYKPTLCHYLVRMLAEKNLLLRHYTQNVDGLERVAGLPVDKLVEAHGSFATSTCTNAKCATAYPLSYMKERIVKDVVPLCERCGVVIKPDAVFFGEPLPTRFRQLSGEDFARCDLLIILGTSLKVQPFASLVDRVPSKCPRLLINMTEVGTGNPVMVVMGLSCGLQFHGADNFRDVAWLGTCDDGCRLLAEKLGWKEELEKLMAAEHQRLDAESAPAAGAAEPAAGAAAAAAGSADASAE